MAESRKRPKKVTEKWKKTEKVPESRKKHLGGNRKMPLSSHGKPEKWEFCGKRKEKLDASQQTEIAGKISCPEKIFPAASGSFFYCVPIIVSDLLNIMHFTKISCPKNFFLPQAAVFFYCFSIIQYHTCQISCISRETHTFVAKIGVLHFVSLISISQHPIISNDNITISNNIKSQHLRGRPEM